MSIKHMKKEIPGSHYFSFFLLYFDAAKFSIKLFSLAYFTVSVVRQRNEYEIVTEKRPIKT